MAVSQRTLPQFSFQSQSGGMDSVWSEMTQSQGHLRPHWRELGRALGDWSLEERGTLSGAAKRMIKELGTTYNVFSDAGGAGQPYELDTIPLLISPSDWLRVRAGLEQRIRLLEAVLVDLFGPQTLLEKGLIPPDLIHSSTVFPHYVRGIQPVGGRFLLTTGCDLVRTATGVWTVLRDHTGTPGGLGQVLENRNVISNLLAEHFDAYGATRLGPFLDLERTELQALAPPRFDQTHMVFLTPGFRHPSFFEHAYKARLLGFPLVEPADLTVRERRLFLKTLSGLRRVDGVICRVDEAGIDPLEHWGSGADGVPGIIEAWRTGNVALANAPGAGLASSPALLPFLPAICREWFGEDLKLPFVETWWLGQAEVRRHVLKDFQRFVLLSASPRQESPLPVQVATLSPTGRKHWLAEIERHPHDFVVQVDVQPSVAPSLEFCNVQQHPVIWRAFTLQARHGAVVMPGGLARVGKDHLAPQLWPAHAGFTKDVWIPEETSQSPAAHAHAPAPPNLRKTSAPEVPSRIAEQLFWLGRYAERIELTTRMLRVTLRYLGAEAGRKQQELVAACLELIAGSALLPEAPPIQLGNVLPSLAQLVHSPEIPGGLPSLSQSLMFNAAAARDRLSDDTWRFFNRLEGIVRTPESAPGTAELLGTLDTLVLHLAAFAGMQAENMTRGHGWRFLEIGRRLERGLNTLALLNTAATRHTHTPLLGPLLETCDSVMTYRRRHFSAPSLPAVIDLLFSDATNPRSVAHQTRLLCEEAANFPGRADFGLMPRIRQQLYDLERLRASATAPGTEEFNAITDGLEHFSDLLTQHFFSHSVRRVY